jgi:Spy/CpxP family protein refolding chaperone
MKIKKLCTGLVTFGMVVALSVPAAIAKLQSASDPQTATKEPGMRDRLQAAVESLNLTDDQKPKVNDIFADAKGKRKALVSDTSLTEDQRKAKMKELHQSTMAKLNEVLTPDQQTELKTKMAAAREKSAPQQ